MARFNLFMIGGMPVRSIEMQAADIGELYELLGSSRFVEGEIVEENDFGVIRRALFSTARIQMAVEAD
ncbi:hypothetical protein LZ518_05445 [Sphingomonas sp. RB56-2]|uniref:Uncharacterized protein n=1 Tax=Sphingomonas brevis TaxID=2908206 RepID=A0ABT0S832_9SPHN|nr:hypothetical protein [Sphingomonas brevis]MCL6740575.1 hypothetical protein [Sphingomonas brevis]